MTHVVYQLKNKLKRCSVLAAVFPALSTSKLFMGDRPDPNDFSLCCYGNSEIFVLPFLRFFVFFLMFPSHPNCGGLGNSRTQSQLFFGFISLVNHFSFTEVDDNQPFTG